MLNNNLFEIACQQYTKAVKKICSMFENNKDNKAMSKRKDLVLMKDTVINGDLVCGNICCNGGLFSLIVRGNIDARDIAVSNIDARNIDVYNIKARNIDVRNICAWNINAWHIGACNIDAVNIDAWHIDARNIIAWNINALNINAWDIDARKINAEDIIANIILCESRVKKSKTDKTIAFRLITQRSSLTREEQMPDDTTKQVKRK